MLGRAGAKRFWTRTISRARKRRRRSALPVHSMGAYDTRPPQSQPMIPAGGGLGCGNPGWQSAGDGGREQWKFEISGFDRASDREAPPLPRPSPPYRMAGRESDWGDGNPGRHDPQERDGLPWASGDVAAIAPRLMAGTPPASSPERDAGRMKTGSRGNYEL